MVEIERKFLVRQELFPGGETTIEIEQYYLTVNPNLVVRIRRSDQSAFLTIKGEMKSISRQEFEYPIPLDDFYEMKKLSDRPGIVKLRHHVTVGQHTWEVDQFQDENTGLWIAEIELIDESEPFEIPVWTGIEVTQDLRYYNSYLATQPYTKWH